MPQHHLDDKDDAEMRTLQRVISTTPANIALSSSGMMLAVSMPWLMNTVSNNTGFDNPVVLITFQNRPGDESLSCYAAYVPQKSYQEVFEAEIRSLNPVGVYVVYKGIGIAYKADEKEANRPGKSSITPVESKSELTRIALQKANIVDPTPNVNIYAITSFHPATKSWANYTVTVDTKDGEIKNASATCSLIEPFQFKGPLNDLWEVETIH